MSQENVEIVRRGFDAFNAGGAEALVPFFSPECVWHPFKETVGLGGGSELRGHTGVRDLMGFWTRNFDEFSLDIHELRDAGAGVLALGWTAGRIKGTDAPVRQTLGAVFSEFRDGEIGEARFFLTWPEAVEAAGLQE